MIELIEENKYEYTIYNMYYILCDYSGFSNAKYFRNIINIQFKITSILN